MRYFYEGNFYVELWGWRRVGWRIKRKCWSNQKRILRFSLLLGLASFSFIKNETFLSFHLSINPRSTGNYGLPKAQASIKHFYKKFHCLFFRRCSVLWWFLRGCFAACVLWMLSIEPNQQLGSLVKRRNNFSSRKKLPAVVNENVSNVAEEFSTFPIQRSRFSTCFLPCQVINHQS